MSALTKKRMALLPGDTGKFAGILSGFILLLAVLPILTMIVMSFSGASNLDFPPSSYSLQWYKAAWHTFVSPDASDVLSLGQAMATSLLVSCLTMVFATLIAVPAASAAGVVLIVTTLAIMTLSEYITGRRRRLLETSQ